MIKWYERLGISVLREGNIPRHIAFIMDGNRFIILYIYIYILTIRRYARSHNMPKSRGHEEGLNTLLKCLVWC